jgi:hypothetical protein
MATTICARIYARGEVSFAKFLFLPSWFAKLLEVSFSCFAKIIWMPSWFAKLLELLLPNPDLIYIWNPERNKIMMVSFPPLKNLHQESLSILYSFFHPPTYRKTPMATTIRAHIYVCGEVIFAKFLFLPS